jgi:uncharacterized protein YgiM (DUF1202 family)
MTRRSWLLFALLAAALIPGLSAPSPAAALSCGPCPGVTLDYLNLRAAPGQNAEVLLVIPLGAEIEWEPSVPQTNGYFAVSYAGVDGYAHGDYLLLFPAFATPTDWLNLRSGPSLDSAVLEVMAPGASLDVLGVAGNGYYSVRLDQRITGYAHGNYIEFAAKSIPGRFNDGDVVVVATDALNVRTSGSLSAPAQAVLYNSRVVTVTGGPVVRDGYTWYRVDASDLDSGWVAGEFLAYP